MSKNACIQLLFCQPERIADLQKFLYIVEIGLKVKSL